LSLIPGCFGFIGGFGYTSIPFFKRKKKKKRGLGTVAQVVEHLPRKCKALISNSSIAPRQKINSKKEKRVVARAVAQ
jgi:hypothetical protein